MTGRKLDDLHRLVDFDVIKTKLNAYIEDRFDHKLILELGDPLRSVLGIANGADEAGMRPLMDSILWTDFPTSAEGFAQHFLYWVPMDSNFNTFEYWVHKVEVQETPKYTAVAELDYPWPFTYAKGPYSRRPHIGVHPASQVRAAQGVAVVDKS